MSKIEVFEQEQEGVRTLDFQGHTNGSELMHRQYQRRNTFGLNPDKEIHRIFQKDFLERDISDGFLTLPRACASIWHDPLENPLAGIQDVDLMTGHNIHIGALVCSFHALCWTARSEPQASDWLSFSHGREAVRVTTTVGKLMDRVMCVADPAYMFRAWLIEVDYEDPHLIQEMQNPQEVYSRMESQGALLALSPSLADEETFLVYSLNYAFEKSAVALHS